MNQLFLNLKDYYWLHREGFLVAGVAMVLLLAQLVFVIWALRRLAELSHIRERISRLADGLALLTDTTEIGLSAIVARLDAVTKTPKQRRASTRASVNERVVEAARKGERAHRIAERETMSESEVRLHLALPERPQPPTSLAS